MKNKLAVIAFGLLVFGLMLTGRASAAGLTGITVSPAFQMVTIQAGAAAQPVSFKITNDRPVAQTLSLSVRDFGALNDSGGLFFVGTNPTALQKKYGLAKWFSLPADSLTIQPHQTATVNAQILNLPDLAGGGHYGALMIAPNGNSATGQVGFNPIASSLMFVTKPAGATYGLSLSKVYFSHGLFNLPKSVTLRFQNTGNTHVVPRGSVYITDPRGKLISKGIVNENSNIILPQTYRQMTVPLEAVGSSHAMGKYILRVDFRFDGFSQYRRYQAKLLLLQWFVFVIIGVALILALAFKAYRNLRSWK